MSLIERYKISLLTLLLVLLASFSSKLSSQNSILLSEQSIKLPGLGEESLYLGLQEGDRLLFNFEELRGKGLKELEIKEYFSGRSLFAAYEVNEIANKEILIPSTGIYRFRFYNAALAKRIGKFTISRIPINENDSFKATVYWKTVYDTTYTTQTEEYVVKEYYEAQNLIEGSETYLNSGSNATFKNGKSRVSYGIELPFNTVEWYYTIVAYREKRSMESATASSSLFAQLSALVDQSGLLGLVTSKLSELPGDDYCDVFLLPDYENSQLFEGKHDDSWSRYPSGSRENIKSDVVKLKKDPLKNNYYIGIRNPDSMHGINIRLEAVAIVHVVEKAEREIQVPKVTVRKVPYLKK